MPYKPKPLCEQRPLEEASAISRWTLHWVRPFLRLCMQKKDDLQGKEDEVELLDEDVFALPENQSASILSNQFRNMYKATDENWVRTAYVFVRQAFLVGFILQFLSTVILTLIPYLSATMIDWLPFLDKLTWRPYALAVGISALAILNTYIQNYGIILTATAATSFSSGITASVHRKLLRLSAAARLKYGGGALANLVAVDPIRLNTMIIFLPFLLIGPFQIIGTIGIISYYVGWASLVGLGVILLYIPFQFFISKRQDIVREDLAKISDERLKLTQETLKGIRLIKYFAWEPFFSARITALRRTELSRVRKILLMSAATVCLAIWLPVFGGACIIALHAWRSGETSLDPGITYMILGMMGFLIAPVYVVPVFSSMLVAAKISAKRLKGFFKAAEVQTLVSELSSPNAVNLVEAEFEWATSEPEGDEKDDGKSSVASAFKVSDLNLSVPHGSFVVVVGRVASGKSSLLSALIGEMRLASGKASLHFPEEGPSGIAYCPQQAWIMAGTVRENVLFGLSFEAALYARALQESCLGPDIQMLPLGDLTVLGESGAGLSGGQKQRLSLARALYAQPSLYLLDDPLSALDPAVARTILHDCITDGMMQGATRLLVTHHVGLLRGLPAGTINQLVVMSEGRITYSGPFSIDQLEFQEDDTQEIAKSEEKPKALLAVPGESSDELAATPVPAPAAEKEEEVKRQLLPSGTGSNKIVLYMRSASWVIVCLVVLFFLLAEGLVLGRDLFLRARMMQPSVPAYALDLTATLMIYTGLSLLQGVFCFARAVLFGGLLAMRTAKQTHDNALRAVMHAAVSFFDVVPMGSIITRFGRDMSTMDSSLPDKIIQCLSGLGVSLCCIVMLGIGLSTNAKASNMLLLGGIVLLAYFPLVFFLRRVWISFTAAWSPVQKRVGATSAAVLACATEALDGLASISAFDDASRQLFLARGLDRIDKAASISVLASVLQRWICTRVDTLSGVFVVFASIMLCILGKLEPGLAGLLILYSVHASYILAWFLSTLIEAQSELTPFDRIAALSSSLAPEDEVTTRALTMVEPAESWPASGSVEFSNLSARFRPELPLVLRNLSLRIESGQKVAIVGRTGSGKSTTIAALFRVLCPAEGSVSVDGVDISQVPLNILRSRLAIVPQDPVLFSGTIRFNLDPKGHHRDDAIWAVLQQAGIAQDMRAHPLGLEMTVEEGGSNFSAGQRQLLCLARALLRHSRILVIDEATANVDGQTDAMIQKVLREHVAKTGCTLITIAHRISTIIDYDRIAVLGDGRLLEHGTPADLLSKPQGCFRQMAIKANVAVPDVKH